MNFSCLKQFVDKFSDLIRLCKETQKGGVVLIGTPHALGDTYEEIIESLNRIADAR